MMALVFHDNNEELIEQVSFSISLKQRNSSLSWCIWSDSLKPDFSEVLNTHNSNQIQWDLWGISISEKQAHIDYSFLQNHKFMWVGPLT